MGVKKCGDSFGVLSYSLMGVEEWVLKKNVF